MNAATLTIDAARVSPSKALRVAAASAPLVVVTHRAFAQLADELGGPEAAAQRLLEIATFVGKPIGVNLPTGPDESRTTFVAPRSWTRERVAGWVAAHHVELKRAFGAATVMRGEDL